MRRLFNEPLLHFFVLGTALFVLFAWLNRGAMEAPDEVVVDQPRIENLATQFESVWQRPPQPDELRGLIDGWVREEILYREGVALGLDLDDTVIRRRVAQKMEFIADGTAPPQATEAELEAWLVANVDRYRIEPAYSLQQVYFDPRGHDESLGARLAELRATLGMSTTAPQGDSTMLPGDLRSASASEIGRTFGTEFADELAELPVGVWQGPLESAYGYHLVRVEEKLPGRTPSLAEVRNAVERDWSAAQAEELNEAFYEAARKRYTVRISAIGDGDGDSGATPASSSSP